MQTGIVYRNIYCFRCNHLTSVGNLDQVQALEINFYFSGNFLKGFPGYDEALHIGPYPSSTRFNDYLFSQSQIRYSELSTEQLQILYHSQCHKYIGTCPTQFNSFKVKLFLKKLSGNVLKFDYLDSDQISRYCDSYFDPVEYDSVTVYKNLFCYLCHNSYNISKNTNFKCIGKSPYHYFSHKSILYSDGPNFKYVLEFFNHKEPEVRLSLDNRELCNPGEYLIWYERKCAKFKCIFNEGTLEGNCTTSTKVEQSSSPVSFNTPGNISISILFGPLDYSKINETKKEKLLELIHDYAPFYKYIGKTEPTYRKCTFSNDTDWNSFHFLDVEHCIELVFNRTL